MPPQVVFSKELMLECIFEIVRKEGLSALSARRIARDMKCSTRPVYTAFRSMADLKSAAIGLARDFALNYFKEEVEDSPSPFLSMGLRYFRFSREEPGLFGILFLEGKMGAFGNEPGRPFMPLLEGIRRDPRLANVHDTALKRLGTDLWIYTHGLILLTGGLPYEQAEKTVRERLLEIGRVLIERARGSAAPGS